MILSMTGSTISRDGFWMGDSGSAASESVKYCAFRLKKPAKIQKNRSILFIETKILLVNMNRYKAVHKENRFPQDCCKLFP
jgi:hypothetical protein